MLESDPRQLFFQAMRQLRVQAGSPGIRGIAERSRGGVSRQTVADVMRGMHVPRWHYVQATVEALGGNVDQVRPLWEAAYRARPSVGGTNHPRPRRGQPLPQQPEGGYEYQQLLVDVEAIAATYNAEAPKGWQPLHTFPAGGNTVWIVLERVAAR